VAITFTEQRLADVVWTIDDLDVFSIRQIPGNRVVIFHESRAVALADIGQHTKKMMTAQANCHQSFIALLL
jgi:hypothetical protein